MRFVHDGGDPQTPAAGALVLALSLLGTGCAVYDAPPDPSIVGLKEGLLPDPRVPLQVTFSKPPVPSTLKVEIALYAVGSDGLLGDDATLQNVFTHDPVDGDTGGSDSLSADGLTMTITPAAPLPAGAQYVLLVEPGLSDATGTVAHDRRQIVFGYAPATTCNAPVAGIASGTYFFLVNVDEPLSVQIALYGTVAVDPATGNLKGAFTKAWRNRDVTRCDPPCPDIDVCRTLPRPPACVAPSNPAGYVDEFPHYAPNTGPPTGFSFDTKGCAIDTSAMTTTFATLPVDVQVTSPMVTLRNAALSASFGLDSNMVLRGSGALVADAVLLGTIDSGMGHGNLTAILIPPDQTPPGLPQP